MGVAKYISDKVDTSHLNRVDLPILFDLELELPAEIQSDKLKQQGEKSLIRVEYYPIVGVSVIMFDTLRQDLSPSDKSLLPVLLRDLVVRLASGADLRIPAVINLRRLGIIPQPEKDLNIVVEIGEVKVGEVLREIISDRDPRSGVDNTVNKPKEILILDLSADDLFHCLVIDARVILFAISLETIDRTLRIPGKILFNGPCGPVYPSLFYARVSISRKDTHPNRLEDIHYCVVYDTIPERQSRDLPLLWLVNSKYRILRGFIRLIPQLFL